MKKNKINILYFMGNLAGGGTETHLLRILTHLNKCTFSPVVVCLSKGGPYMKLFQKLNIQCYVLNWVRINHYSTFIALFNLFIIISKHKIHIIQTFHYRPFIFASLVRKITNTPVLIDGQRNMKKINPLHLKFVSWCNKYVDLIISNSNAAKLFRIQEQNIDSNKIVTIYNGVNLEELSCQDKKCKDVQEKIPGIDRTSVIIGILSLFDPRKGHRFAIEAMGEIIMEFPDTKLLLVGDGDTKNAMEELSKNLGLSNHIIFTGFDDDVSRIFPILDIVLLPSQSESFPNIVIEAMAAGKAVIATRVGGVPEVIENEKNGILIPPGDSKVIAKAVIKLLKDKKLRKTIETNAAKTIKERFRINDKVRETERTYERLLRNKIEEKKFSAMQKIAILFYYTGLTWIAEKLLRGYGARFTILFYHRICEKNKFKKNYIEPYIFEKQLLFIKKHFNIIPFSKLMGNSPLPQNALILTFDDGYRDNYEIAFPLLKKYNVLATIFLTTDYISKKNKSLWWEELWEIIVQCSKKTITLNSDKTFYLSSTNREDIYFEIRDYLKSCEDSKKEELLKELRKKYGATKKSSENAFLSWEEVKKMSVHGIEFGAHTCSHPILTRIPLKRAKEEISKSIDEVKTRTGKDTHVFCYPNGKSTDFNDSIKAILKENGIKYGLTTIYGINHKGKTDPYALFRIGLGNHANYYLMRFQLSGIFMLWQKIKRQITY